MKPTLPCLLPGLALALTLIVTGCRGAVEEAPAREEPRPNVLLISVDTLRPDHLGMYGYERPTSPFLDGLAARGVRFENAFAQASWTLPSHMSLMTSAYPQTHGVEVATAALPAEIPLLAESFAKAGYSTSAFVSWVYLKAEYGFGRGFDTYVELLPPPELQDSSTIYSITAGAFANQVSEQLRAHPPEGPAFLFLHLFDPHMSYAPPLETARLFDPELKDVWPGAYENLQRFITGIHEDAPSIPPQELAQARALYDGEIRHVDDSLQRLLQNLVEIGFLTGNSIIAFTSDHGEEFDDHGSMEGHQWTLYDEVVRVPLFLLLPGGAHSGEVESRVVQSIDIAPTLLDAAGIEIPQSFEGHSLLPLLEDGSAAAWEEEVFLQIRRFNLKWALRTPTHKLIFNQSPETDDQGRPLRAGFELYDLISDPGETTNVFDPEDPVSRGLATRLKAYIERRPQRQATTGPELSEEERERLKSLGYVE